MDLLGSSPCYRLVLTAPPIDQLTKIACLIDYKYQFANNKTYVCSRVENVVTAPKRGRKPNSVLPILCASSFVIHLKIPKVFKNVVAHVNYNERGDTIV